MPVVGSVPNIYPIPQIYSTYKDANSPNGYNAEQWYRIALYSELKHNKNMYFSGVLTQQMACSQKSNCSQDTKNSSADAFSQLANQLFSDPYGRTTGVGLNYYWRTDIGYFEGDPN